MISLRLSLLPVLFWACASGHMSALEEASEKHPVVSLGQTEKDSRQDKKDASLSLLEKFSDDLQEQKMKMDAEPFLVSTAQRTFVESGEAYGLGGIQAVRFYAVDFDADGYTDLVSLPDHFAFPEFRRFDAKKKRFELIKYSPFAKDLRASFLIFVDLDRDGLLDLLLGTLNQKSELQKQKLSLYKAEKKKGRILYQKKELPKKFLAGPNASVSVLDYNLDGLMDLFVGNWLKDAHHNPRPMPDQFLEAISPFQFKELSLVLTDEYKTHADHNEFYMNARPTFSSSTCDLNQDGYPDILTTSTGGFANKLWMNEADPRAEAGFRYFLNRGEVSGYAHDDQGKMELSGGGNSFFSSCADFDHDGIMDIFLGEVFSYFDPPTRDKSSILKGNFQGDIPSFLRFDYVNDENIEKWQQGDRRAVWVDLNLDGNLDLIVENTGMPPNSRLVTFLQEKDHGFQDVAKDWGLNLLNPSGIVVLDVDRDGRPDILSGQTSVREKTYQPKIYLFKNMIKPEGQHLRIYPQFKSGQAAALGAMVKLITDKQVRRFWYELSQGGLSSQNEEGIFVAWPHNEKIQQLEIRFPLKNKQGKVLSQVIPLKPQDLKGKKEFYIDETGKALFK